MEFSNSRGHVTCCLMVLLAGCLSASGFYLDLKVTAVNGLIAAIGLCLAVVSAYKGDP